MKHKLGLGRGLHKVQKCCRKIPYETRDKAEGALLRHLYRVVFSSMEVYNCFLHDGFHLGHSSRMSNAEILSQSRLGGKKFSNGVFVNV
jgi:hypothetical protein